MTMKFKKKDSEHRAHHFVVDKSLEFGICSVCGEVKARKIVGWETREEKI